MESYVSIIVHSILNVHLQKSAYLYSNKLEAIMNVHKTEVKNMANYAKTNIGQEGRVELHNTLSLTGAEISINNLPAGACVPFVHSHKNNEEVYGILSGRGKAIIDGEKVTLTAGDWIRISPASKRQFFASEDQGISYVCIQTKQNSLDGFTADDAVIY